MKPTASLAPTTLKNITALGGILVLILAGCQSAPEVGSTEAMGDPLQAQEEISRQASAIPPAWQDFQRNAAAWRAQPVKPPVAESVKAEQVLAENALREKHPESAVDHYETGLALNPMWPEGHFNVARLYAEMQDYYQAVWHMRAFLELAPDSADAQVARDQLILWQDKLRQPRNRPTSQTWTDPETHLMWPKQDNGQPINWRDASEYCKALSLGGFAGWRLPTLGELERLYDPARKRGDRIKGDIQLTGRGAVSNKEWLWSSNVTHSPEEAWYFSFGNGTSRSDRPTLSEPMRVLCVRYAQRMF